MNSVHFLLADIGGTNARFALADADGVRLERTLSCADYPSLDAAAEAYLAQAAPGVRPAAGAFAVASPVTGDVVRMTNLPWEFSIAAVRDALDLSRLDVINDFTAVALSVPELGQSDRVRIGEGAPEAGWPIGVIGPGSGLGVSALVPVRGGWRALATEGGHVTMPTLSARETAVVEHLGATFGHVSAERLLSGPGLTNIHAALRSIDGIGGGSLSPAAITDAALADRDALCVETVAMFCAMLGTVAGNLALTLGARGGVYVAGGIAPRILDVLAASVFRARFLDKGRMRAFLEPVPTYVVTHPYPAFLGLAAALRAEAP